MTDMRMLVDESRVPLQQIVVIGLTPAQSFIAFGMPLPVVGAPIVLLRARAI